MLPSQEFPKEYRAWRNMRDRCLNPKHPRYLRYGGRGINVCDRWLNSFESFLADLGPAPSPRHTVDRRNNDGHYEPDNCRWATYKEQANNQSSNAMVTYQGETHSVSEWYERLELGAKGLKLRCILSRIRNLGWPPESAFNEPAHKGTRFKGSGTCRDHQQVRVLPRGVVGTAMKAEC